MGGIFTFPSVLFCSIYINIKKWGGSSKGSKKEWLWGRSKLQRCRLEGKIKYYMRKGVIKCVRWCWKAKWSTNWRWTNWCGNMEVTGHLSKSGLYGMVGKKADQCGFKREWKERGNKDTHSHSCTLIRAEKQQAVGGRCRVEVDVLSS